MAVALVADQRATILSLLVGPELYVKILWALPDEFYRMNYQDQDKIIRRMTAAASWGERNPKELVRKGMGEK